MHYWRSKFCLVVFEPKIDSFVRELFGPILPIVPVANISEAIGFVNARYVIFFSLVLIACLFGEDHSL